MGPGQSSLWPWPPPPPRGRAEMSEQWPAGLPVSEATVAAGALCGGPAPICGGPAARVVVAAVALPGGKARRLSSSLIIVATQIRSRGTCSDGDGDGDGEGQGHKVRARNGAA